MITPLRGTVREGTEVEEQGECLFLILLGAFRERAKIPDDPANHRVKVRNLAAVWRTYRAAGAQCLIMSGPVEDEATIKAYAEALSAAGLTLCRLHARRQHLTERIMSRGRGGSWDQPGDPLRGQSVTRLLHVADHAVASAASLEDAGIGDLRIDTDGHTVEQVADAITADAVLSELCTSRT